MQTNSTGIFAAGNCAQIGYYTARNWSQSAEQGRVAALNMLGFETHFQPPAVEIFTPLILEPDRVTSSLTKIAHP
jgi:hypothetical protein